ncbi:MAG: hypothetical protein AAF694_05590 [Bacteroidota bacterium]
MDSQDSTCVDRLFEEARKVPVSVSVPEVKATLSHAAKPSKSSIFPFPTYSSQWQWGIAASIILLVGFVAVFFRGTPPPPANLHPVKLTENSSPFVLLDTYRGEEISYWDTSQTPYPLLEAGIENIRCFQTYMEDTACYLTVALELGQPDLIHFALADLTGAIVSQLLVGGRQYQSDSSYNFDLCQLQSGKYDLLIQTDQGDKLRKQIVLN